MKWLKLIAILAPLISGCAKSLSSSGGGKCCPCEDGDGKGPACWQPDAVQLRMYQVLCYYRENAGLEPQRLDAGLSTAATAWARQMAADGTASFADLRISQNVAEGYRWPRDVFRAWMRRHEQRARLMGSHRLVGVGHAMGVDGRHYWVTLHDQLADKGGTGEMGPAAPSGPTGAVSGDPATPLGKSGSADADVGTIREIGLDDVSLGDPSEGK